VCGRAAGGSFEAPYVSNLWARDYALWRRLQQSSQTAATPSDTDDQVM
jgi:hypothetical protein